MEKKSSLIDCNTVLYSLSSTKLIIPALENAKSVIKNKKAKVRMSSRSLIEILINVPTLGTNSSMKRNLSQRRAVVKAIKNDISPI